MVCVNLICSALFQHGYQDKLVIYKSLQF